MIRISPTFLYRFGLFINSNDSDTDRLEKKRREIIDGLNGVEFTNGAIERGKKFEASVLAYCRGKEQGDPAYMFKHGHALMCDKAIYDEFASRLVGGLWQMHVEFPLFPDVMMHGYPDVINYRTIYDIKTTKQYGEDELPLVRDNPRTGAEEIIDTKGASDMDKTCYQKYRDNLQHLAYMGALASQGMRRFEYLITDFRGFYVEQYVWEPEMLDVLRGAYTEFADYLRLDDEMREAFENKQNRERG